MKLLDPADPRRRLDRYELIGEIATGGMATVYLARRGGVGGFQRFVAIKRLHPHLQNEPEFVEMFLDEARLAALIHHPNVVPILEVGENEAGYYLVMEYVEGDTLSRIVARTMSMGQLPPRHVALRILLDTIAGLHAAHELRDDRGQLLGLVHRDVSPQNVLVGVDGTARITDFGVARASSRLTSTAHGKLKGKLAYMAPEQTRGDELDRRTDLFAMGIILWEVLCGRRLFKADSEAATLQRILVEPVRAPSEVVPSIPKPFDAVVLRSLDRDPERRFQTAADLADALEDAARESAKLNVADVGLASPREVASFVQAVLGQEIGAQRESVRAWLAQSDSGQPVVIQTGTVPPAPPPPQNPRTMVGMSPDAVAEMHASMPPTERGGSSRPPPGHDLPESQRGPAFLGAAAAAPVVPQFEVAADVTMRFALEKAKPAPVPRAESPRPRTTPTIAEAAALEAAAREQHRAEAAEPPPSSRRPPASAPPSSGRLPRPRLPPPAPPSQPTLLGQGPGGKPQVDTRAIPPPTPSTEMYDRAAAAIAYSATVDDDLGEDVETIARPGSKHPEPLQPAVKTARGLAVEPLLAQAKAHAMANGTAINEVESSGPAAIHSGAAGSIVRTPRMPMPADQTGESKVQLTVPSSQSPVVAAAAVIEAIPIAPAGRPQPRTLVSATGEVSTGGFTPGSMTLPTDPNVPSSSPSHGDQTVLRDVPKRSWGKYAVVFAAFLLVFGTGLLLLKSRGPEDQTNATKPAKTDKSDTKEDPKPTATATTTSPPATSATATTEPEPTADHDPKGRPRPGGRGRPKPTATATADATSPPTPPPTSTGESGEDLKNPYR
ncbi:MAG: serine/threonine protein kinase [Polyangiaceae bacterium]|nr:serine/threonine protein kinase [Polyangiaceae bacterium]